MLRSNLLRNIIINTMKTRKANPGIVNAVGKSTIYAERQSAGDNSNKRPSHHEPFFFQVPRFPFHFLLYSVVTTGKTFLLSTHHYPTASNASGTSSLQPKVVWQGCRIAVWLAIPSKPYIRTSPSPRPRLLSTQPPTTSTTSTSTPSYWHQDLISPVPLIFPWSFSYPLRRFEFYSSTRDFQHPPSHSSRVGLLDNRTHNVPIRLITIRSSGTLYITVLQRSHHPGPLWRDFEEHPATILPEQ